MSHRNASDIDNLEINQTSQRELKRWEDQVSIPAQRDPQGWRELALLDDVRFPVPFYNFLLPDMGPGL